MNYYLIGGGIIALSYLSAKYHKRNGYFFWRTFILAIIGFTGLFLIVYQMFM